MMMCSLEFCKSCKEIYLQKSLKSCGENNLQSLFSEHPIMIVISSTILM